VHVAYTHACGRTEVVTVADAESHLQDEACGNLQLMMHVKHELQVLCCSLSLAAAGKRHDVVERMAVLLQHASRQLY